MHKAIEDQNYCSQQGDAMNEVSTNAYYFKSNNLFSGEHISRLSLRMIFNGYQNYEVDNEQYLLDANNYLIVNEGAVFCSEIKTNEPVEALLIAFNQQDISALASFYTKSETELLDDPFDDNFINLSLDTETVSLSRHLKLELDALKQRILSKSEEQVDYEEQFNTILEKIFFNQKNIQARLAKLKVKKRSTRKEIYKRLNRAKNYLDCNFKDSISLNILSNISTMSSYHFQRSFKTTFGLTPHQYLVKKRLLRAKFLLKDSEKLVGEIAHEVGFQNQSAFGRLFKSKVGMTPQMYRNQ